VNPTTGVSRNGQGKGNVLVDNFFRLLIDPDKQKVSAERYPLVVLSFLNNMLNAAFAFFFFEWTAQLFT
jgi:hypothetical protein